MSLKKPAIIDSSTGQAIVRTIPIGDSVDPVAGGTGLTSYAVGDLPYASAVDTLAKLPIGSAGEVLQVVSGNVSWETDIAGVSGGRRILGGTAGGHHLVLMPEPGGQGRVYIGDDSSSSGGTYYNGVSSRWRWTIGTASPGDGMQDHTFILAPDDGNSAVDPGDGIRFEFRGVNSVVTEYEMGFLEFEVEEATSGSEVTIARIGVADGPTAVAQIEIKPRLITIPEGDLILTSGNVEITDGDLTVGSTSNAQKATVYGTAPNASASAMTSMLDLVGVTTNDDVICQVLMGRRTTNSNTANQNLAEISTVTDTAFWFLAHVVARRTGGTAGTAGDCGVYRIEGGGKNIGGTITVSSSTTVLREDQAGWDANAAGVAASPTLRFRVTGATNNDITWHITVQYGYVGS